MSRIKNPVWKCWSQPQIIVIPCGGLHVYNRTSTFPDYILILPDGILDAFEIRRNRTMNGCFVLCTENGDIYDIKGSYMFILGYVKDNYLSPNEKRKPKRVKWVYDHLGRLWMSFRCRSDVVQMSFRMSFRSPVGFKNLTYCSVTDLSTQTQAVAQGYES